MALDEKPAASGSDFEPTTWTGSARKRWLTTLPPEKMLPETQPSYVASWIYVFGMLTIVAMALAIISGVILTLGGVQWFHESSVGKFFNSTHYWSVQLFFLFMVVHLWGKYWMAAWRGKRALTWATGVLAFLTAVGVGFTGYVITTNFNAQWIAFEAKDVMNAIGVGSVFTVTNLGQMVTFHVAPLPILLVVLVAMHVLLVRKRGVVPPIDAIDPELGAVAATASGDVAADAS
jgi:ubiquinol-cytochrome c reductase cytochrome b subunit